MDRTRRKSVPELPDKLYLAYYFREGQTPFEVLTDLDSEAAESILKADTLWRGDGTYLTHRRNHERLIRELFIQKGAHPSREHPIYAILGESPIGPHDLENEYAHKLRIPLKSFLWDDVSFTYPDSLYEVPLDDLGRLHLERNIEPVVYTIGELDRVIAQYKVYQYNNHYIEAQIWNDQRLAQYAGKENWLQCMPRQFSK